MRFMIKPIRFEIFKETPSLNYFLGWHFGRKKREREAWKTEFTLPGNPEMKPPIRIKITSYRKYGLDFDNLVGGFKPMVDGLRDTGLIPNDGFKKLFWEKPDQEIVKDNDDRRTVVELEEI